jgi:hypothetical protein
MRINVVRLAYRHRRRQLRSPLACGEGHFPSPKAVRNAILAWKPPGKSGECRIEPGWTAPTTRSALTERLWKLELKPAYEDF